MSCFLGETRPYLVLLGLTRSAEQQVCDQEEDTQHRELYDGIIPQLREDVRLFVKNIPISLTSQVNFQDSIGF